MPGNSCPWPVARPTASARSAWARGLDKPVEVDLRCRRDRPRRQGGVRDRRLAIASTSGATSDHTSSPRWGSPPHASARVSVARAAAISAWSPRGSGRGHRTPGPFLTGFVLQAIQSVCGEFEHQGDGLGLGVVGQVVQPGRQASMGLFMEAQKVLDARARGQQPDPQRRCAGRDERQAFEQGAMGVGEAAGRRQRGGVGQEKVDALIDRSGVGRAAAAHRRTIGSRSRAHAGQPRDRRQSALRRRLRLRPSPRCRRGGQASPARLPDEPTPARSAGARRSASRLASPHRRRAARSDDGTGIAWARWSSGRDRGVAARRSLPWPAVR